MSNLYFFDFLFKDTLTEAENKDFGTRHVHKFLFKVMEWVGIPFKGVTDIVNMPQKASFDAAFCIKVELPIVKRGVGNRLIGSDMWPPKSLDLNPIDYFLGTRSKYS